MKHIKILFAILTVLIVSCEENDISVCRENHDVYNEDVKLSKLEFIKMHIENDVATTRSNSQQIIPYVYEGDTVMYLVNYDEGWEIYSNDTSVPMIIASSETGKLEFSEMDDDNVLKVYMDYVAETLHLRSEAGLRDSESIENWRTLSYADTLNISAPDSIIYLEDGISATSAVPPIINPDLQYVNPDGSISIIVSSNATLGIGRWVYLRTLPDIIDTPINVPHLLSTQWDQDYPWNEYTPFYNNTHAPAGCAAVAVGQYLYYANQSLNRPFAMPTSGTYDASTNEYTFSGFSTSACSQMATTGNSRTQQTDYTAIMLGHIGNRINMSYGPTESGATTTSVVSYLNELGFQCQSASLTNDDYAINSVANDRPLLLSIQRLNEENQLRGHMIVIDAAKVTRTTKRDVYGWLGTDRDGNSTVIYDSDSHTPYYLYVCFHDDVTTVSEIGMNWGWDDTTDNRWFSPLGSADWAVGSRHYNYYREIYKTNL